MVKQNITKTHVFICMKTDFRVKDPCVDVYEN